MLLPGICVGIFLFAGSLLSRYVLLKALQYSHTLLLGCRCYPPLPRQIYQPQFGMGNQLRALEAALAVARVLRRMLVVPDYMADNGEGESRILLQYSIIAVTLLL